MQRKRYTFSSKRAGNIKNIRKQKPKFPELVKEIIKISDIVLEILDARFIEETRNKELEKLIKKQGKQLIYVLNKADLIDIKTKLPEIHALKLSPYLLVSCRERKGVAKLRDKIKIEVKKLNLDYKRAQIGIIGYPNTGKSSLINVLTGKASAKTGAQAGFTRGMQKIRLAKDILMLDTPGVIPESEYSHTAKEAIQTQAKISARTLDTIRDPEIVVSGLLKDYSKQIEEHYQIEAKGDIEVLMEKLGRKKNFLKKGNLVDEDRTLRIIIKDWQEGKIKI